MSALRLLALSYLASASVFVVTATLVAHPQMTRDIAAGVQAMGTMVDETIWQPLRREHEPVVRLALDPKDLQALARAEIVPPPPRQVEAPELTEFPSVTITIAPDLIPEPPAEVVPVPPRIARNDAFRAAPAFRIPDPPSLSEGASRSDNKMNPQAPVTSRAAAAALRLKAGLTQEMTENFDLFLYVSKAERGPLAQRMYVFRKTANNDLALVYDWAASTGREQDEISPRGRRSFTATPKGYYQLDPRRMYRSYRSVSWDQDMPNAMFFNWERAGLQTGLAIHAASGDSIAKLGQRASAGCIHLAPEHAAILQDMIRAQHRGPVPRFAYNAKTQTMSNKGAFMRDRDGNLKMADGYRVLVTIEDYSGADVVAALF